MTLDGFITIDLDIYSYPTPTPTNFGITANTRTAPNLDLVVFPSFFFLLLSFFCSSKTDCLTVKRDALTVGRVCWYHRKQPNGSGTCCFSNFFFFFFFFSSKASCLTRCACYYRLGSVGTGVGVSVAELSLHAPLVSFSPTKQTGCLSPFYYFIAASPPPYAHFFQAAFSSKTRLQVNDGGQ